MIKLEHLSVFAYGVELLIDKVVDEMPHSEYRNKKLRELKEICDTYVDLPIDMIHKTKLYNVMPY